MAIQFPELPFAPDALEPYISRRTLEFHYGKHHKKYVDTLNTLIAGTPYDRYDLDEIMEASRKKKPKIFNNAAQAWNHAFYWNCLGRNVSGTGPTEKFERSIEKAFGSLREFREKFNEEGKALFGSGWVWLVKDKRGALKIRALPNAENPTLDDEVPLLVCDVWEHAYYLDYQNERPKYLDGFWSVVNWDFVETSLELTPGRTRHSMKPLFDPIGKGLQRNETGANHGSAQPH
jgi:Fe-Mn family superoxide dismutase